MNSKPAVRLGAAGVGTIATGFGMGRYGYSLLLPNIQHSYGLSTGLLGVVASASYGAYLAANAGAGLWTARLGPRATVAAGGLLATLGMLVAGLSERPVVLVAGVIMAGGSCGLVYPPFADATGSLSSTQQRRTLSAINCGTGYGVAIAAPLAIATGASWRAAWLLFAACALVTTAWSWHVLGGEPRSPARSAGPAGRQAAWGRPGTRSLMIAALLIGMGSAAYWTFAVDDLQVHGISSTLSRVFLAVVGVASLLSTITGDLIERWGLLIVFRSTIVIEAAGVTLLAIAPSAAPAAFVSAIAFGASFNAVIAVLALWSAELYPRERSRGLAIAMGAAGIGQLCGPLASGLLGQSIGLTPVLLIGTAIVLTATVISTPQDSGNPHTSQAPPDAVGS